MSFGCHPAQGLGTENVASLGLPVLRSVFPRREAAPLRLLWLRDDAQVRRALPLPGGAPREGAGGRWGDHAATSGGRVGGGAVVSHARCGGVGFFDGIKRSAGVQEACIERAVGRRQCDAAAADGVLPLDVFVHGRDIAERLAERTVDRQCPERRADAGAAVTAPPPAAPEAASHGVAVRLARDRLRLELDLLVVRVEEDAGSATCAAANVVLHRKCRRRRVTRGRAERDAA